MGRGGGGSEERGRGWPLCRLECEGAVLGEEGGEGDEGRALAVRVLLQGGGEGGPAVGAEQAEWVVCRGGGGFVLLQMRLA